MADDNIQHGIDDNPSGDAEKGAVLGGVGGAIVGALAGGPVGAVIGAIAGAAGSGAGVAAVDRVDNDNTVSGLGTGATTDANRAVGGTPYAAAPVVDNGVPGVQTGGRANDGTPDTRGIMEKTADTVTGDVYDDKTGKPVVHDSVLHGSAPAVVDNGVPGVQTGGRANDGTPDTRGIMEKTADAVTGDTRDDKTGKVVNHD